LKAATGTNFWPNQQTQYDLARAERKRKRLKVSRFAAR